jgi:hypothetical protein
VETNRSKGDRETPPEPGKPDMRPVRTFYPEAPNIEAATPLQVAAGQDLTGIDIRQRTAATYHIRGKVVGILPEGAVEHMGVNATSRNDDESMFFMFSGGSNLTKERTFDIAGLAPGPYTVHLLSGGRGMRALGQQDVDVGQGDVNDVQLTIVQPGTLRGQVLIEGNPRAGTSVATLNNIQIYLSGAETSRGMFGNEAATPKEDGSFTLENVAPGKYYLHANQPSGTYLKSVRFGNQEILGKHLDLSEGFGQLVLVFSYEVAELDGTVQLPHNAINEGDSSGSAQATTTPTVEIALVSEKLNEDGSGVYFNNTGAGGAFQIKQLPPGHYHAYALEQIDYGQFENPDFLKQLESKGVEVDVKENEKKQIQLPLITEDEMQQIYARLGIEVSQQ